MVWTTKTFNLSPCALKQKKQPPNCFFPLLSTKTSNLSPCALKKTNPTVFSTPLWVQPEELGFVIYFFLQKPNLLLQSFSAFLTLFRGKAWKIKPRVMGHSCGRALRCSIGDQLGWLRHGELSSPSLIPCKKQIHPLQGAALPRDRVFPLAFSGRLSIWWRNTVLLIAFCPLLSLPGFEKAPRRQLEGLELE